MILQRDTTYPQTQAGKALSWLSPALNRVTVWPGAEYFSREETHPPSVFTESCENKLLKVVGNSRPLPRYR